MKNPFRYFSSSPEVIRLTVLMYIRYPLSLRQVEDLLQERGIDICHETVGFWWNRFGLMFAAEVRKWHIHHGLHSRWRWHLDDVFVRINGETLDLWRAIDHDGEVLEVFATKRRDHRAALKFLKRAMKRYGRPRLIVTDRFRSYRAAMKVIGNAAHQICGRWANKRAENSNQPLRRREGAMAKFRDIKTLKKFVIVHASIHDLFNSERHLNRRAIFKQNRSAALVEWRRLAA
ncbi:MAG: IS6 family transposase [Alphaproteobacteria bacterium]